MEQFKTILVGALGLMLLSCSSSTSSSLPSSVSGSEESLSSSAGSDEPVTSFSSTDEKVTLTMVQLASDDYDLENLSKATYYEVGHTEKKEVEKGYVLTSNYLDLHYVPHWDDPTKHGYYNLFYFLTYEPFEPLFDEKYEISVDEDLTFYIFAC